MRHLVRFAWSPIAFVTLACAPAALIDAEDASPAAGHQSQDQGPVDGELEPSSDDSPAPPSSEVPFHEEEVAKGVRNQARDEGEVPIEHGIEPAAWHDNETQAATPIVKRAERPTNDASGASSNGPEPLVAKSADDPESPDEIETAGFNGVQPGVSTMEDVRAAWGEPQQTQEERGAIHQLFAVEPFREIDVTYRDGKVATIVIFLDQAFPSDVLAQQLELTALQAVIIPDAKGRWLGQAYPERGVLFGFDPAQAKQKQVAQIVLEPVSAPPFLLRAESRMDTDIASALSDLDIALRFNGQSARVHALRGQALLAMTHWKDARQALDKAVELDADDLDARQTRAELLREMGEYGAAVEDARHVVNSAGERHELRARGLVELARSVSEGPDRDYRRAADYCLEAIKLSEALSTSNRSAQRRAAVEISLDAHLELAGAVAWGFWRQKEKTVPKWLDRAEELADVLAERYEAGNEHRLRVVAAALAADVGLKGALDPAPWLKTLKSLADEELAAAKDPVRRQQLEWKIGMAYYNAMQVYHQRRAFHEALEAGSQAVATMERAMKERDTLASDAYLLGRLYFRLGSLYVAENEQHDKAVVWFEKARPLIEQPLVPSAQGDLGRQGETMVSMAVSYWSTGKQQQAVSLTEAGAKLMEKAAEEGLLDGQALSVPYNNLATMHRYLGDEAKADEYVELAARSSETTLK